jgi:hypothetical protein
MLIVAQLVNESPVFYGSRRSMSLFRTGTYSEPDESSYILKPHLTHTLILPSHLRLYFLHVFRLNVCIGLHFPSPVRATYHLIFPDFITLIIFDAEWTSWSQLLTMQFPPASYHFLPLRSQTLLSTLFSDTLNETHGKCIQTFGRDTWSEDTTWETKT